MSSLKCYQNERDKNGQLIVPNLKLTNCSTVTGCQYDECKYCASLVGRYYYLNGVGFEGTIGGCAGEGYMESFGLGEDGCMNANATDSLQSYADRYETQSKFRIKQFCICTGDGCNDPSTQTTYEP